MLNSAQPLSQTQLGSALGGTSRIKPNGSRFRRTMVASLMLTSLVDAFSILVIFLIMNNANSQDVVNVDKVQLPMAAESQFIQEGIVVRVENGRFVVDEKPVEQAQLISTLKSLNESATIAKKEGIVIVADRNMDYEALSPVILAGSQAGFTKFKFAVIRK
ncbi:MAG: biopolymer transporter ExbD [Bdellovibrionales bacterium]|nr:biopolymer transporter ExbD [Bdellovibrionales bacterium]